MKSTKIVMIKVKAKIEVENKGKSDNTVVQLNL